MSRTGSLLFACLALAAWSAPASAGDADLRALLLKAQKAHGGKAALNKYRAMQVRFTGEADANGMPTKVEGEVSYQFPDRMKNVITVEINGMKIEVQQGYDGKALWMDVVGMKREIKDKDLIAEMKESMYAEHVASLADIDSKDYTFQALGEMKIKGAEALGVRVTKKDRRFVDLWVNKKTLLLVKTEYRGKDPFGDKGEANQEKYFSDYKEVSGVQTPQRLEVHTDGKKIVALEMTDIRYSEKLDDSHFERP